MLNSDKSSGLDAVIAVTQRRFSLDNNLVPIFIIFEMIIVVFARQEECIDDNPRIRLQVLGQSYLLSDILNQSEI